METVSNAKLDTILDMLFTPYRERVPDVEKVTKANFANDNTANRGKLR